MRAESKNRSRHLGSRGERGFSLIELLIVVAIILIIAAIAIPNLLRSKIAANEASAAGTLRTMHTAAHTYFSTWSNGYPPSQATMGGAAGVAATCNLAQVIDSVLAVPGVAKSGPTSPTARKVLRTPSRLPAAPRLVLTSS
jgi:prepilin-type N-terminal cleavage/methylation domain-containing protein